MAINEAVCFCLVALDVVQGSEILNISTLFTVEQAEFPLEISPVPF